MTSYLGKIIADFETSLATKLEVGGTTASLQSATDDDGVSLPAGRYFFTIDAGNAQKEHIACTLSGTSLSAIKTVSRQGTETSGAAREHRVGAKVKITDFAHIKRINNLLDGTDDLDASTPLKYDGTATISNDNELATKAYVDGVAIAGGADASTTTKGITKMSVAPASATSPIAVGDNDPRVPTAAQVGYIPTSDQKDALAGTSGTPSTSNKYVTADDVSSAAASGKIVRAIGTALPALSGANLTSLPVSKRLSSSSTPVAVSSTTTETAIASFTLTGGLLSTTNFVEVFIPISDWNIQSGQNCSIRLKYGSTTLCTSLISGAITNLKGFITARLSAAASATAQDGYLNVQVGSGSLSKWDFVIGTATETSSGDLTLQVTAQNSNTNTADAITVDGHLAKLSR